MADEPTLTEVLTEVRNLRTATAEMLAATNRNLESQLRLFMGEVRLLLRESDTRIISAEVKQDVTLSQLRTEIHEVRTLVTELLNLAHTHDGAL